MAFEATGNLLRNPLL